MTGINPLMIGASLGVLLSVSQPAVAAADECGVLLESRCTVCHYKSRICNALGKKNERAWRRTIKRMVGQGAKLTPDEQDVLAICLDKLPAGADMACRDQPVARKPAP